MICQKCRPFRKVKGRRTEDIHPRVQLLSTRRRCSLWCRIGSPWLWALSVRTNPSLKSNLQTKIASGTTSDQITIQFCNLQLHVATQSTWRLKGKYKRNSLAPRKGLPKEKIQSRPSLSKKHKQLTQLLAIGTLWANEICQVKTCQSTRQVYQNKESNMWARDHEKRIRQSWETIIVQHGWPSEAKFLKS